MVLLEVVLLVCFVAPWVFFAVRDYRRFVIRERRRRALNGDLDIRYLEQELKL